MTITRFKDLYNKSARADDILWPDLFKEFSKETPFLGSRHPGWSPAEFDPPQRNLDNVKKIHALVLDYDNKTQSQDRVAEPITVEDATEMFGDYMGVIHTTRHHTKEWPRFRVILPLTKALDRLGFATLWQAAARRWPGLDPLPKDPSRFWYTPGVADHEGASFEAVTLKGAWLDPVEFCEKAPKPVMVPTPGSSPPGTNLEARARAYVEKMPPAVSGSGGHGALFAVARKLICDFGLDPQAATRIITTEYNPRCSPPWSDKEIAHKVQSAFERGKVRNPVPDRELPERVGASAPAPPSGDYKPIVQLVKKDEWRKNLQLKPTGGLTKDVGNVALILANDPKFQGCLKYDRMAYRIVWDQEPDYEIGLKKPKVGETLSDHHAAYVQQVLTVYHYLSIGKDLAFQGMEAAAHENEIHPVQHYLDQLEWDGVPRLEKWLHTYLGCDDNEYTSSVGKWWMISAVARAYQPGCQADHVLILEGKQGKGKSQAIKAIGGEWVLDALPDIRDSKTAAEVIAGKWIVEIAELDALRGAGLTRIKSFVTQQFDDYRPAYARASVRRPRPCIFIGTTNEHTYLEDPTGARRFWPVRVGIINRKQLEIDRDQLWAEAKFAYENGECWYPQSDEMIDLIEQEQADRYTEDAWTGLVDAWIKHHDVVETGFTSDEILGQAINLPPDRWDRSSQARVGAILTKLGYVRKRVRGNGSRAWKYFAA